MVSLASVRRDGSSRFVKAKQWGNFYSVGGRWNIDEAFIDNVSFIDALKLRKFHTELLRKSKDCPRYYFCRIQPQLFCTVFTV
jgi:hypothetical protein